MKALTRKTRRLGCIALGPLMLSSCLNAAELETRAQLYGTDYDLLKAHFESPPNAARPRVWWHWLGGNVSLDGIEKDLTWMSETGIAGIHIFNADLNTPKIVDEPLQFGGLRWRDAIQFALGVAKEKDLEVAVSSSPGWSLTGGPWVKPEDAMKKLVWSETQITKDQSCPCPLQAPPTISGPFQDVAIKPGFFDSPRGFGVPQYYQDERVVAIRLSDSLLAKPLEPVIRVSGGNLSDIGVLHDRDLTTKILVSKNASDEFSWISYTYPEPVRISSAVFAMDLPTVPPGAAPPPAGLLEVSRNGIDYQQITSIPLNSPQTTVSFETPSARFFRLKLIPDTGPWAQPGKEADASYSVLEFRLDSTPKVNRFEEKAGFAATADLTAAPTPEFATGVYPLSSIIDITDEVDGSGTLSTRPGPGDWMVLRFGSSLMGRQNWPASPAATGLEVDKLHAASVRSYIQDYLGFFDSAEADEAQENIQFMLVDSYESGPQNWSKDLLDEFRVRRGYNPEKFLPVLTGTIVESASDSDKFLWDFRRTLSDLIAENHYGEIAQTLADEGMQMYAESHESHRSFIGDGMEAKMAAAVPMAAFWVERSPTVYESDIRESASVANIYGQNFVAAESFTTSSNQYGFAPADLKPAAIRMMAAGVNRFVIHTSVHQPMDDLGPGMTLNRFGQWFTRHETWAEFAGAWIDYLSRSSHLLQQGRNVSDIGYFYGEDTNIVERFKYDKPEVPAGFRYDFVNRHALLRALEARSGSLVSASGANYSILIIDPKVKRISLSVLEKLRDFVKTGGVLVGHRPEGTLSYADDEDHVKLVIDSIWGDSTVTPFKVVDDYDFNKAVSISNLTVDLILENDTEVVKIDYVHRELPDIDIYFAANLTQTDMVGDLSFRIQDKVPERWVVETGETEALPYFVEQSRTKIPISLGAGDSVFIVFSKPKNTQHVSMPPRVHVRNIELNGDWKLTIPAGGESELDLSAGLLSWHEFDDPEVKYFSGTGEYRTSFDVSTELIQSGHKFTLDLGDLQNIASVSVNGNPDKVVWSYPFRLDISGEIKVGENMLEIQVANLWPNRLIGETIESGPVGSISSTFNAFTNDSQLRPAGLLGPVIIAVEK